MTDAEAAPAERRRSLPRSALLAGSGIVAGSVVVLLSSSPVWIRVTLAASGGQVKLSGRHAAASAVPLALVSAAGLIALALVRTWLRRALAVLILAAGIGALVAAIHVIADPVAVARASSKVKAAGELATAQPSAAPYLCLLGAALIIVGAALALLFGGRWPGPTRRYERGAATRASRPVDAWEALERGDDPTDR